MRWILEKEMHLSSVVNGFLVLYMYSCLLLDVGKCKHNLGMHTWRKYNSSYDVGREPVTVVLFTMSTILPVVFQLGFIYLL